MSRRHRTRGMIVLASLVLGCGTGAPCGPGSGRVVHVVDGDTLDLADGERVRILGIDAPESYREPECGADEAQAFLEFATLNRQVALAYESECRDRYGRLLAHVSVGEASVGLRMIEEGLACPLFLEPNRAMEESYVHASRVAKARGLGLWGHCRPLPCR